MSPRLFNETLFTVGVKLICCPACSRGPFTGHNTANPCLGVMGSDSAQFVRKCMTRRELRDDVQGRRAAPFHCEGVQQSRLKFVSEIEEYRKTGWSNSQNFQIFFVMRNTLKAGGSGW
ncbi:MAG: hypothetical protein FJW39_27815 [Acidobacteria bacterium]|nr:hypothetical protein [Acidobacteriota bacterium]